ncbi:hypothetical protein [Actinomadura geliboluensis]
MGEAAQNKMVVKRDPKVVAEVRQFVRLVTGEYGMDDFVPWLVASELVTNALQHATSDTGEDVILRLSRTEDDALWMGTPPAVSRRCWRPTVQREWPGTVYRRSVRPLLGRPCPGRQRRQGRLRGHRRDMKRHGMAVEASGRLGVVSEAPNLAADGARPGDPA